MSLSKKQRQEVYAKSDGHCWYCGCDLPDRWHADHVEPVMRSYHGKIDPCMAHLDTVDNMVPACPPCNLMKSASTIESFRKQISRTIDVVREYSVKFRNAERFGVVKEIKKPVVFWFEKEGKDK